MKAPNAAARAHALVERALEELDMGGEDNAVIACHLQFAFDLLDQRIRETAMDESGKKATDSSSLTSRTEEPPQEQIMLADSSPYRVH